MSTHGSTSDGESRDIDTDNLSGAYALNALSDDERHAFETRMAGSHEIRTEVAELNDTALLLGRAVEPVQPSAGLRASIMDLLDSTPQLPRLTAQDPGQRSTTPEPSAATAPSAPAKGHDADILDPTPLARQRWFMRPAALLVGAAAAAGLFFGGGALLNNQPSPNGGISASNTLGADASQILAASDVRHTSSDISTGGTASLYWSNDLKRSVVVLDGVSALPSSKTYQLWYIKGSNIKSAGTVNASSNTVTQVLQGDLNEGDVVGITVEPTGGSKQPTTKPVVALESA
jgi:anti-sigma-K factor RskA